MEWDQGQIIGALIGAIATIVAALIAQYVSSESGRRMFWLVVAIGLAATSLALSVFSWSESRTPQFTVVSTEIQAHTAGQFSEGWRSPLLMPHVPAPATQYELDLRCDCGYVPIAAWHEVRASHPALDVTYTISADVVSQRPVISLRARRGKAGYAYVEVIVLCSRVTES